MTRQPLSTAIDTLGLDVIDLAAQAPVAVDQVEMTLPMEVTLGTRGTLTAQPPVLAQSRDLEVPIGHISVTFELTGGSHE
ncbi:MAG: hypothetical protein AAGI10_11755 [Pseudomonadota bacterium]